MGGREADVKEAVLRLLKTMVWDGDRHHQYRGGHLSAVDHDVILKWIQSGQRPETGLEGEMAEIEEER